MEQAIEFTLNGELVKVTADPNTPLLWIVRDSLNFTGSKFGCGMAQCGACTMMLGDEAVRTCVLPVSAVQGQKVTTIEGLHKLDGKPEGQHPLQVAWQKHNVPQCGYCQSGQLMSAAALLKKNPKPNDSDIDVAMAGNICRCGTYGRIKAAIKDAAKNQQA